MNRSIFALAMVLVVSPLRASAQAGPWVTNSSQHFSYLSNVDDLTNGLIKGRILVDVTVDLNTPASFTTGSSTSHDDESGSDVVHVGTTIEPAPGSVLAQIHTKTSLLDSEGHLIEVISEGSDTLDYSSFTPIAEENGKSIFQIGPMLQGQSLSGKEFGASLVPSDERLLLSVLPRLYIQAAAHQTPKGLVFDGYRGDGSSMMRVDLDLVHQTRAWKGLHVWRLFGMTQEEYPVHIVRCERAGELLKLPPVMLAGSEFDRVEDCYPMPTAADPAAYKRMTLLVGKPKTERQATFDQALEYFLRNVPNAKVPAPVLSLSKNDELKMNCHGYSLRAVLKDRFDLPSGVTWIFGALDYLSEGTVALDPILRKHFQRFSSSEKLGLYTTLSKSQVDAEINRLYSQARAGDLITFFDGQEYIHSGVLVKVPDQKQLWIESKFEDGPVATVPLENINRIYTSYTRIDLWRMK